LYRYVGNSAPNGVDPAGHEPKLAAAVAQALAAGDVKFALFLIQNGITRSNAARLTGSVISTILSPYPARVQRCTQSAQLIAQTFKSAGYRPVIIRITDARAARFFSFTNESGKTVRFASNGFHEAVLVENRVFDALTGLNGKPLVEYIQFLKTNAGLIPQVCNKATGVPIKGK